MSVKVWENEKYCWSKSCQYTVAEVVSTAFCKFFQTFTRQCKTLHKKETKNGGNYTRKKLILILIVNVIIMFFLVYEYTVVKFIIIYQMKIFLFQESKAETKEEKKGNTPSKETVIKRV